MAGPSGSTAAPAPQDARALTRRILALAVPAFGALIAEPLFLLADTAIIGHLGTAQLAGVGIGTTILHTLTGLMIFLAYATTPAVARLIGAGNPAAAMDRGRDGIWLGLLLGAANLVGGYVGARMAIARGTGFIRVVYLMVVAALIVKVGADTLAPLLR